MQIIFHIDLNAFFASAEVSQDLSLKGKPIVVSKNSKRSIVTTASYEARKYGINSAMPLFIAKEKCPNLIVVEPHFDLYRKMSNDFFNIISNYSTILEIASIDECYVDMTNYINKFNITPKNLALTIQNEVYNKLHLKCSIGIAPNKFLAKMGSDMKKPMGITIITNNNYKEILWPIPIEEMYGIGKKTAPKLKSIGIITIGDLALKKNYYNIKPILGKNSFIYYQRANGKDFSKINYDNDTVKSISKSITFENDTNDIEYLKQVIKKLSLEISTKAIHRKVISNNISITLKYKIDKSITRQLLYDYYFNDFEKIYSLALLLLERNYNGEYIRLIGIGINNIISINEYNEQLSLFEKNGTIQEDEIDTIIKQFNKQGNFDLKRASSLINNHNKYQKDKH